MMTRNYGSMHDEIILATMSIFEDPMTEREIEDEVNYEDIAR